MRCLLRSICVLMCMALLMVSCAKSPQEATGGESSNEIIVNNNVGGGINLETEDSGEAQATQIIHEIEQIANESIPSLNYNIQEIQGKIDALKKARNEKESDYNELLQKSDETGGQPQQTYDDYSQMSFSKLTEVKIEELKEQRGVLVIEMQECLLEIGDMLVPQSKLESADNDPAFTYNYGDVAKNFAVDELDSGALEKILKIKGWADDANEIYRAINSFSSFPATTINHLADTVERGRNTLRGYSTGEKTLTDKNIDTVMHDFNELCNAYDDIKTMSNNSIVMPLVSSGNDAQRLNKLYRQYQYTITAAETLKAFGG